jgi:hypothetical protein
MTTSKTPRSKSRNTFNIVELKDWVNQQLERTDDFADDKFKAGLCCVIEHVLTTTNRYKGYNDNYWLKSGFQEWRKAGEPGFPEKNKYCYGPSGQRYNRHYY